MKKIITLTFLINFSTMASTTYQLECSEQDLYTDMGTAKIELKTTLKVIEKNNYILQGGTFKLAIGTDWTNQEVKITEVQNKKNYRPRVYSGYVKFPNLSDEFSGNIDLLISEKVLESGKKSFNGVFIFTAVEDHWGDTIGVSCKLK